MQNAQDELDTRKVLKIELNAKRRPITYSAKVIHYCKTTSHAKCINGI